MLKIVIANGSDILYNSLSDILLQKELAVELKNIPKNKLDDFICKLTSKDKLIILDSNTTVTFCSNILKNAINCQIEKLNIIILVIDSNSTTTSLINREEVHRPRFFKKQKNKTSLLQLINIVNKSLKDTLEIEKNLNDLLWKLGFTSYFKGTIYLRDTIYIAYSDRKLLLDTQTLIKKVSEKNNDFNDKVIRSDIDRSLNAVLDNVDIDFLYSIFGDFYDGRKISLKYFIDLCIHYLDDQRYCCLDY